MTYVLHEKRCLPADNAPRDVYACPPLAEIVLTCLPVGRKATRQIKVGGIMKI
ncbi:MAG: hypothetical protein UV63_C0036G0012 [Microgenomates group bacterium GW2011_GWC1_43_11]|uniref:Uncharacterized protein n=1 Tax=Candidatus Gottesmanbacteria bacterium GW2011_GWA1_44_24b TaxID=1618437 RepID=A0A0G1LL81_9BACT|nr:MAG: hypothetical protein UV63_C0036G0012 [Microgenomates group bacterium GW2011_GWC1_43_11]KKT60654.1 MAG: hypothetical protein UW52_C0020G0012 [Candidatus Gottesmanbacteria bacterium GW2011_GWA1_44_24b]